MHTCGAEEAFRTSDYVISVQQVSKMYPLYADPRDRLKQSLWHSLPRFLQGAAREFYKQFWALHDISFEVKRGEAFGIIGRNGSGKSTLLQIIAGTLSPTSGEVYVRGKVGALLELGSGFNPDFSGKENVYLNGAVLGFLPEEMDRRFEDIAAFADIGEFIDQPVKTYSSGMFVRLAFAVQTSLEPDVLLIDEALAVGDIFFRQKCYRRLAQLQSDGCAIILVSHGMNEVEQFCRRALLIDHGKELFQGTAIDAVKHYYLIEQEDRLSEAVAHLENAGYEVPAAPVAKGFDSQFWPLEDAFIDLSPVNQITNGWARCTGVALCNAGGQRCMTFQQGETASFFYEFELLHDIEVPVGGIVLQNHKGANVHGKSTLEYGTEVPETVAKGNRVRLRQDIALELEVGEYTVGEVGFGMVSRRDFQNRQRCTHAELASKIMRLCTFALPVRIAVLFRHNGRPVQLMHHGIANLPGECRVFVLPESVESRAE